jgi:photosystem II stability/assembly factor-like uncharacterized protein
MATILAAVLLFSLAGAAQAQGWEQVKLPMNESVTGMSWVNHDTGYVVTSGAKYGRTFDGGRTWKFYTVQHDSTFEDVYFLNKDTGIVCGRFARAHRTVDGCKNWEIIQLPENDRSIWLTSALLLPGGIGLMVGIIEGESPQGVLYRSEDAGKTWTRQSVKGLAFGELFYHPGDPICFQSWGRLYYSMDKGKTWSSMSVPSSKPTRATTFFKNSGILCGNNGAILCTADRGKTWQGVKSGGTANFTSALLLNEKTGYIAGTGGTLLKTTDGGQNWTPEKLPVSVDFAGLYNSGEFVYAYGASGVILRLRLK